MCPFWLELFLFNPGLHTEVELLSPPGGQPALIDLNPESKGKEIEWKWSKY